jgi:hypothetical protein
MFNDKNYYSKVNIWSKNYELIFSFQMAPRATRGQVVMKDLMLVPKNNVWFKALGWGHSQNKGHTASPLSW